MVEHTYEKRLARAVIDQAIKDIGRGSFEVAENAFKYVGMAGFLKLCETAGYPPELSATLSGLEKSSPIQRRLTADEILTALRMMGDGEG